MPRCSIGLEYLPTFTHKLKPWLPWSIWDGNHPFKPLNPLLKVLGSQHQGFPEHGETMHPLQVGDEVTKDEPLTTNPNVGGFGQAVEEVGFCWPVL